jgi:hypothetical protein
VGETACRKIIKSWLVQTGLGTIAIVANTFVAVTGTKMIVTEIDWRITFGSMAMAGLIHFAKEVGKIKVTEKTMHSADDEFIAKEYE